MSSQETIELAYQKNGSDKIYIVELKQDAGGSYLVHCRYGRRGSTMNHVNKTPTPVMLHAARNIFDKVVKEKTSKGYQVINRTSNDGNHTVQPQPVGPTKLSDIMPQLLNHVRDEDELENLLSDDAWYVQEKMDGERRMLSRCNGGEWVGHNKKGLETPLPEELIASLSMSNLPNDVLLDGEIIGDVYYVFDVLLWGGKRLDGESFHTRSAYLGIITATSKLVVVEVSLKESAKRAFLAAAKARNSEGIVFKHSDALYESGRPNSGGYQLKYKFVESATVTVSKINKGKRSVAFGAFDGSMVFHALGNVTIPPNQEIPDQGSIIEVRYLYAFKGGSLFQPVYLGKRGDQWIEDCTLSQLKYKSVLETIPAESSQDARWGW